MDKESDKLPTGNIKDLKWIENTPYYLQAVMQAEARKRGRLTLRDKFHNFVYLSLTIMFTLFTLAVIVSFAYSLHQIFTGNMLEDSTTNAIGSGIVSFISILVTIMLFDFYREFRSQNARALEV